jgi:rhodanese-related sulfurtransferase
MKFLCLFVLLSGLSLVSNGQKVLNPEYDKELRGLLNFSVPTMDVSEAIARQSEFIFLDAREMEEYKISHIRNARYVGYNNLELSSIDNLPKATPIIVYCSVGYRSEKIAEKLIKKGYSQVYNLYGSIFEWANCNQPLYDIKESKTNTLHTYNKKWSRWVDTPLVIKTW